MPQSVQVTVHGQEDRSSMAIDGEQEQQASKQRPVVAVVDDDPVVLEALEDLLESAGYSARGLPSAASLLSNGLSGLDVIITDIGMPGMDGFELCDAVNSVRPEMPVFLMTGRHDIEGKRSETSNLGIFRKPFDTRVLLAAVKDALA